MVSPFLCFRRYRGRLLAPAEAPGLYRIAEMLTRRAGLDRVPRLFILPVSAMNAFTVGTRRDYAIGITDGLLRALDARELTGVLAHEISHLQHHDLWIMNLVENLTWFTRLFSLFGQWMLLFSLPFLIIESVQVTMAMGAGVALLITAPWLSFRLKLALSRAREYQADAGAALLADDALGLASALQKIQFRYRNLLDFFLVPGRKNDPPGGLQSHPDTDGRIRRLLGEKNISEQEKRPVMLRDRRDRRLDLPRRLRHL